MLTTRHKLEIAGAVLALAACAVLGGAWLGAREEAIRAKATVDAQNQVIATAEKRDKDLVAAETERDKATAANVAALQAAAARQTTPAEIAAWLPKQLSTPQPITFTIPAPTAAIPVPNAVASIPQADLPALRDEVSQCQVCGVRLATAQSDLSSRDARLVDAGEKLSAMTKERDTWKDAAKGGGFWSRVKRSAKWLVIGIGVGAVAVCGSGHCK
jgi:hypothetical protein